MRIFNSGIRPVLPQQSDEVAVSAGIENGVYQRRVSARIPGINGSAGGQKCFGDGDRVRLGGEVKRSPAIVIGRVHLRAEGQEGPHFHKIAFAGSVMEFGAAVVIKPWSLFSLRLVAAHPFVSGH